MNREQRGIVQAFGDVETIDLAEVPSRVAALTMSPREIRQALDACVRDTREQPLRLEQVGGGPTPVYRWVKREEGEETHEHA